MAIEDLPGDYFSGGAHLTEADESGLAALINERAGGSATSAELVIYISDLIGDDDLHDGLSPEEPVQTPAAAWALVPLTVQHQVELHFLHPHQGAGYVWPAVMQRDIRNGVRIWVTGDPAGSTTLVAEQNATGGTSSTVVDSGATWVVDAYKGKTVRIVSGPGAGSRTMIKGNDGTTLTIFPTFLDDAGDAVTITASSRFVVEEPLVDIVLQSNVPFAIGMGTNMNARADKYDELQGALGLINVRLVAAVPGDALILHDSHLVCYGVELSGAIFTVKGNLLRGGMISAGYEGGPTGLDKSANAPFIDGMGAPFRAAWYGWGIATMSTTLLTKILVTGFMVSGNTFAFGVDLSLLGWRSGFLNVAAAESGFVNISFDGHGAQIDGTLTLKGYNLQCFARSVEIDGGALPALVAEFGAYFRTAEVCTLTSTGATAIQARYGAKVYLETASLTIGGSPTAEITIVRDSASGGDLTFAEAALASIGEHRSGTDGTVVQRVD